MNLANKNQTDLIIKDINAKVNYFLFTLKKKREFAKENTLKKVVEAE